MAQQINDNFSILAGIPIEQDMQKSTIGGRDAIKTTKRWQGMTCYVIQTNTLYQLQGGIENSNWIGIAGSNVTSDFETEIEGFLALSAGKATLNAWEIGDKFRGWIGTRYVVGSIVSLPVSLPSDIDDAAKVELAIDSNASTGISEQIEFTATGGETTHDIGTDAIVKSWFWDGSPQAKSQWSQSGSILTFAFPLSSGSFNIFI